MVAISPTQTNPFNPFTAEHEMFRKSVRKFVENEITPYADEWEAAGIAPLHDLFKKMGNLGFLGLNYAEQYGGAEADIWFTVVLHEEITHWRRTNGSFGTYRYVYTCPRPIWQRLSERNVPCTVNSR
jgi:alkylation response protein AidB-like acyl-CoA dehydrogenase